MEILPTIEKNELARHLGADEFARFSFLASTPPGEGPIAWKAIQTYSNGVKNRWIGPAGSESPAAVTTVSKRFPKQNAGGEGDETAQAGATGTASAAGGDDPSDDASEDESDDTARWLGAAALAVALVSLAIVLLRRRRTPAD